MSSIAPPLGSGPRVERGGQFLVGRDLATTRPPRRTRGQHRAAPLVWIGVALVAALSLASLRVRILDLQMRLGAAVRAEEMLDQEVRALRVEVRELRSPKRLKERAAKQGFEMPKTVRELRGPGAAADPRGAAAGAAQP